MYLVSYVLFLSYTNPIYYSQSKSKKKEEVSDEIVEEKTVGTHATVKDVIGRTGSRGGVIQVSVYILHVQFSI